MAENEHIDLTPKQKRFCEEYMKDLNATQAAKRAGYSQKTATIIGCENLTKPNIRQYIETRLKELTISADETTKLISDIAKASLNKYFVVKQVKRSKKIKLPLKQVIKQIEQKIKMEDEFASQVKLSKEEKKSHADAQESRKREIVRLQIELKHNPKAYQIVDGPEELVEEAELDMAALIKDKEAGRIKSVVPNEYGYKIELYSAEKALECMAKMHGLFEKDNTQQKPDVQPIVFYIPDNGRKVNDGTGSNS